MDSKRQIPDDEKSTNETKFVKLDLDSLKEISTSESSSEKSNENSSEISSETTETTDIEEKENLFSEEEMEIIEETFPEYMSDIQFGGFQRLVYFDSEFFYESGDYERDNKSPTIRVFFKWLTKYGISSIEYVLRYKQFEYFNKILEYELLKNKKTFNILDVISDDYQLKKLSHELKFKYRIECLENGKILNRQTRCPALTKEIIRKLYMRQYESMNKNYYDNGDDDINDIIHILYLYNCKITIVDEENTEITCDLLLESENDIRIDIDRIVDSKYEIQTIIIPHIDTHICIYHKEIMDLNYGKATIKYYYDLDYLRQFIPYFADFYVELGVYIFYNRDYEPINSNNFEIPKIKEERIYFFREGSPLHGGDINNLKNVAFKIRESVLASLKCLNPNPNTDKLLRLPF